MDFLVIVISVLLICGVLVLILYPMWQAANQAHVVAQLKPLARVDQRLEDYQTRYDAVLSNIKQLMFDHEIGKIATEDYEQLLHQTKLEAAKIRQQIDYMAEGVTVATEFVLSAKAEMLVKQTRQTEQDPTLLNSVNAELVRLQSLKPDLKPQATKPACPHCGQAIQPNDAFCAACGRALKPLPTMNQPHQFCTKCGQSVQPDDAFCLRCGTALQPLPEPT